MRPPIDISEPTGSSKGPRDPDQAASLQLILSIGRSFKFVDDYVRPRMLQLGLTMTEFSVLSVLFHGGPVPLGQLSDRILLTGASTTYTVKKLEERKLMTRTRLSGDNRVVMGAITQKGRELMTRIQPLHAQHLIEVMHSLTTEDKQTIVSLLRKLRGLAPNQV